MLGSVRAFAFSGAADLSRSAFDAAAVAVRCVVQHIGADAVADALPRGAFAFALDADRAPAADATASPAIEAITAGVDAAPAAELRARRTDAFSGAARPNRPAGLVAFAAMRFVGERIDALAVAPELPPRTWCSRVGFRDPAVGLDETVASDLRAIERACVANRAPIAAAGI